jgi:hypothetical protein
MATYTYGAVSIASISGGVPVEVRVKRTTSRSVQHLVIQMPGRDLNPTSLCGLRPKSGWIRRQDTHSITWPTQACAGCERLRSR